MGRESWYEAATVTAVGLASVVDQIAVVLAADKERKSVNELQILIQIIQLLSY